MSAGSPSVSYTRGMPMLLVDGDCGFCMRAGAWLQAHTRGMTVLPLQQVDLAALGLDPVAVATRLHMVGDAGVRTGAAAVTEALRHGSRALRLAAALLDAPGLRVLAQLGYDRVARWRHRLPGGSAACELP